jgi:hypothetical protein
MLCGNVRKDAPLRTVFVFPRVGREETIRRLGVLAAAHVLANQVTEWILDDVLWIRLLDSNAGLYDDWEPGLRKALARAQGGALPSWAIIVDVSGRVSGQDQVRRLIAAVAAADGHVLDDHDGEIWTAFEVTSGEVAYGWPGFSRVTA